MLNISEVPYYKIKKARSLLYMRYLLVKQISTIAADEGKDR
jgi:hypothetical protein